VRNVFPGPFGAGRAITHDFSTFEYFDHTSMTPPTPISCVVREKLIQLYEEAAKEHHRLNMTRITAVFDGPEPPSAEEVAEAQMRKENAKYVLQQHMEEHGCGWASTEISRSKADERPRGKE
jgi:hypothetical protein